jgi:hypothetical protein
MALRAALVLLCFALTARAALAPLRRAGHRHANDPASSCAHATRSCSESPVVIVGSGWAGLAAADELAARGCKVVVLESKSRFGGRSFTSPDPSFPRVELGSNWIHGRQGPYWYDACDHDGCPTSDSLLAKDSHNP